MQIHHILGAESIRVRVSTTNFSRGKEHMKLADLISPYWTDSFQRLRRQYYCGWVAYKGWQIHTVKHRSIWESNLPERDYYTAYVGRDDDFEPMSLSYFTYKEAMNSGKALIDRRVANG